MKIFIVTILMLALIIIEALITYKVNGGEILLILFGIVDIYPLFYLWDRIKIK
jgi:hypothetical protein